MVKGGKKDTYLMIKPASDNSVKTIDIADNNIVCNRESGQFFGMFIGDGWADASNGNRKGYHISIASIHDEIIIAFRTYANKFLRQHLAYTPGIHHKNTKHDYWDNHTSIHGKFTIGVPANTCSAMLATFGHGAKNKTFPDNLLNTPNDFRWGLLSGLMDTDGTFTYRQQTKNGKLCYNKLSTYSTVSINLANKVQLLCFTLGINASITTTIHKHDDRPNVTEYLVVLSVKHLTELRDNLSLILPYKKDILHKFTIENQAYRKDIVPYDNEIHKLIKSLIPYKDRSTVLSLARNRGYITRQTMDRYYYGPIKELYDTKFNYNHQYEIVKEIIEVPI